MECNTSRPKESFTQCTNYSLIRVSSSYTGGDFLEQIVTINLKKKKNFQVLLEHGCEAIAQRMWVWLVKECA